VLFDVVNHKIQRCSTLATEPVLQSELLARQRPVFLPGIGNQISDLRKARGWTIRGAASIAARQKLNPPLTYQVLFRLENGQTKSPDPEVLRALADLYRLDYIDLVGRVMTERYSVARDLLRHGGTGQTGSHQPGGVNVPAETRLRELLDRAEQERDVYKKILARAGELTGELADVLRSQGGPPASPQTSRGGGARRHRG
jgi:transcriptional regulator with XRE-family HTH domain